MSWLLEAPYDDFEVAMRISDLTPDGDVTHQWFDEELKCSFYFGEGPVLDDPHILCVRPGNYRWIRVLDSEIRLVAAELEEMRLDLESFPC